MNVLAGSLAPDAGEAILDDAPLQAGSPRAALAAGIAAVHQSPMLFERMTWEENLALGGFDQAAERLDLAAVAARARALAAKLGFELPPAGTTVENRSVAERVRLEVLRALSFNPRVLILDEPTSVLAPSELNAFLDLLRNLRGEGRIVVLITINPPGIFYLYFALPLIGIKISAFACGLIALVLHYNAYNIEVLRSGIETVPVGLHEAGMALGFTHLQRLRLVIIPMALRIGLPALVNNYVSLLKNTALVSIIGVVELTFVAQDIIADKFTYLEMYTTIAVVYLCLIFGLTWFLRKVEKRYALLT